MPEVQTTVAPVTTESAQTTTGTVAEEQKTDAGASENAQVGQKQTAEQQEQHKQSKFQRRLERQKTARIQAETRAEIAERERDELRARFEAAGKQQATGEPKREDFTDYEAYVRALAKYEGKTEAAATLKAEREQQQGRQQQESISAADKKVADGWVEREKAFQATTKDYEDVVGAFVEDELSQLAPAARRAIVESEVGPQLLYHLATHPDVAERIADLSPARQAVELGKLEDKMPAMKKTSSAPAPASPVNSGRTGSKDPQKMNAAEYREWMKANGSRFVR